MKDIIETKTIITAKMRKILAAAMVMLLVAAAAHSQVITTRGGEGHEPGSWICFRNSVELNDMPKDAELRIAADSKYWLWVNGEPAVAEGGLKRGPNPTDTYCDVVRNVRGLRQGKNEIAVLVWYFGKDGFSHRNSPTPGMTFSLRVNGRDAVPDGQWRYMVHPAYYVPAGDVPNFRLAESNIGFDATRDIGFEKAGFDCSSWPEAKTVSLNEAGWNALEDRPIPMWRDYGLKPYAAVERKDGSYMAHMPYNAQITPYIRLRSLGGDTVRIMTDNYMGGSAANVFAEYVTRRGEQEFECKGWMNGHYVIYQIPEGVEVLGLKYRETGYNTTFAGSFTCDDPMLSTLWQKAQRTLYITMRDTYMDCPDRERSQWWGDVVNELGEAFYALDENAHLLTRKGIRELMAWQRPDSTIYAPVPSGNYDSELPMQMLASVGYYGFWTYYMGTGDRKTIEDVMPGVKKYIHLWKTDNEGLVVPRSGGWTWGDWGEDKDMALLFNLWYAIALDGYGRMAALTGNDGEAKWAARTAERLKSVFHKKFWNGKYYVSPGYNYCPDDRAQALAVVAGVLPKELYPVMRPFFAEHMHASPYMEKYVLEALCTMGYEQDALNRMKTRYADMINSKLTTLWEGWGIGSEGYGGGTYNHAWSGGPLTILSSMIAGIKPVEPAFREFAVKPAPAHLSHIDTKVPLSGGRAISLLMDKDCHTCRISLNVPEGTAATIYLCDGYTSLTVNGKRASGTSKRLKSGSWTIEMSNDATTPR